MKTKKIKLITLGILLAGSALVLTRCTKNTTSNPANGVPNQVGGSLPALVNGPIPAGGVLDTSWEIDQVHSGMCWYVPFQNVSNTNLTGKFSMFNFAHGNAFGGTNHPSPRKGLTSFWFDPNNLSQCYMNFWLQMCTFNTGQPGRDGNGSTLATGKGPCGPGYVGVVYQDSTKDTVYNAFDTAYFVSTSFTQSGTGYIVQGNFTFNHWAKNNGKGFADGTPITYPMTIYLVYNGMNNIITSGTAGTYWAGFTGTTNVDLTKYIGQSNVGSYSPVPGELPGIHTIGYKALASNVAAVNNTTYGAVSSEVGTQVAVTINCIFYKAHQ